MSQRRPPYRDLMRMAREEGVTLDFRADGSWRVLPFAPESADNDDLASKMDEVGRRGGHGAPAVRH